MSRQGYGVRSLILDFRFSGFDWLSRRWLNMQELNERAVSLPGHVSTQTRELQESQARRQSETAAVPHCLKKAPISLNGENFREILMPKYHSALKTVYGYRFDDFDRVRSVPRPQTHLHPHTSYSISSPRRTMPDAMKLQQDSINMSRALVSRVAKRFVGNVAQAPQTTEARRPDQ